MKIAQVVCAFPPYAGGIGNSAYKIETILKTKHEVFTFTPQTTRPLVQKGHGAILVQLLWRLKKFDYIYLHYPFFGTAEIIWLFKIFNQKTKLIIHYHMDVENKSWLNKILSIPSQLVRESLLKKADLIISASFDYIKHSQIKNFYQSHPEKFKEIPFGVDTTKFIPKEINLPSDNSLIAKTKKIIQQVNELFIKRDRLDLIFVGGLDSAHYFKGVDILLKSLAFLKSERKWHLNIIGEGDLRPEYEALSKRLGLEKKVDFLGKLNETELIKNLQNSDLLILPSINSNEAFGLVLIEALACGVPVIASDLPGVRSVFTNLKEGLLVEPGKMEDLSAKIDFILENESLRKRMSQAARQKAIDKYDQNKIKQMYEDLFVDNKPT